MWAATGAVPQVPRVVLAGDGYPSAETFGADASELRLSRAELLWVVAGVWAFLLIWSRLWLDRFNYGPFEWAWRSLVQWKPQRMLKARAPAAAAAG